MFGQYPTECSIVFDYELNQIPFSAISPLSIPLPLSIEAMYIELFVLQWSSVTSQ